MVHLLLIWNISCASLESRKGSRKRLLNFEVEEQDEEKIFVPQKSVKDELKSEIISAARALDKAKLSELITPLDSLPDLFDSIIREFLVENEIEAFQHTFDA